MLHQLDHQVIVVSNGRAALDVLADSPDINIVICDMQAGAMAEFDVLQACPAIRPNLPVVLMSSEPREQALIEALRLGAVDYLQKPVDVRELSSVLERIEHLASKPLPKLAGAEMLKRLALDFDIPSRDLSLCRLQTLIRKTIQLYCEVQNEDLLNITLAFEEAVLNAHEHGNLELKSEWKEQFEPGDTVSRFERTRNKRLRLPHYSERRLQIRFWVRGNWLGIRVEDEGPGFDADALTNELRLKPYGMGLMLIRNLMDRVSFNPAGNCITFEKKISQHRDGQKTKAQY